MCKTFFEFYPEPNRDTCLFVEMRWKEECDLRAEIKIAKEEGKDLVAR